jgi:chromosome segregation ATPase
MMCKMAKKAVLGAGLGLGALALLFGTTKTWNYIHYACQTVRDNVQDAVPFDAQIDNARREVESLNPAIERSIEALAKLEENVKELNGEIVAQRDTMGRDSREILALRNQLGSGDVRRTGLTDESCCEVKADLARRLDLYKQSKQILKAKEETLKARQQQVAALKTQLDEMKVQRKTLLSQIDAIEARHKALEASRSVREPIIDTGAADTLAHVKKTVAELNKRVNIEVRADELRRQFSDRHESVAVEPGRDVLKEVDQEFGTSANGTTTADKNL